MPCSLLNFSFPTSDWTWALAVKTLSLNLVDHQGIPLFHFLKWKTLKKKIKWKTLWFIVLQVMSLMLMI